MAEDVGPGWPDERVGAARRSAGEATPGDQADGKGGAEVSGEVSPERRESPKERETEAGQKRGRKREGRALEGGDRGLTPCRFGLLPVQTATP